MSPTKDSPSLVALNDFSSRGITTRVMAKKNLLQLQKDNEEKSSSRRNSKFLSGTSIPNSTIRSSLDYPPMNRLQIKPKTDSLTSPVLNESEDNDLDKTEDRESSVERGLERMRKKIRNASKTNAEEINNEYNRERRRSSAVADLNTTIPQQRVRRPTLESIRDAINNSPNHLSKLVNADSYEKKSISHQFTSKHLDILTKKISITGNKTEKKDLQTQTSQPIEKILLEVSKMRN